MDGIWRIMARVVEMLVDVSFLCFFFVRSALDVRSSNIKYILLSQHFPSQTSLLFALFRLKIFQIGCWVAPNKFRGLVRWFPSSKKLTHNAQRKDLLTIVPLKSCGLFSELITVKLAPIRNANATFLSSRDWLSVFTLYYFPSSLLWMCAHPTGRDLTGK